MKGVVVQVGHPKSVVLFNNGKIGAIPTPDNCHVGMVVTVKYNSLLKIMIISIVAALLIAFGIYIGANYFNRNSFPEQEGRQMHGPMHGPRRRMMERWR